MSKDLDRFKIYKNLLPELVDKSDLKDFLFEKIQSMCNPYYKSRALYQLAEFYDEKSYELLNESFTLTKNIQEPTLKFQVLEKIFSIIHYKELQYKLFIQQIVNELVLTFDNIKDLYNQFIASIRLSFYGSGEFRKKYLTNAIEILTKMDEDDNKLKLIIKLKPLINIYDDLQIKLNEIIETLKNKIHNYFINSYYGRILFTEILPVHISNLSLDISQNLENENSNKKIVDISDYTELQGLFLLFAQLNDIKLVINKTENTDQLWINLFKDTNNQSNIEKILNIGLRNEIFLTPQVAIIIDELLEKGKEDTISIIFPYIIKPSNEVLPIVHRWFTDYNNNQIKKLSALLLAEAKHIFEPAIDTIIDLLKIDNDQMRYRAQRIFQHPERNPKEPNKRISVISEKTLMKILKNILYDQITQEKWLEFARILSVIDTSQFREKLFFVYTDVERIEFIIDNIYALTNINDEIFFEILESKIINEISIKVENLAQNTYNEMKRIGRCNFYVSNNLNKTILNILNNISINIILMENLIKWLILQMTNFKGFNDTIFSLILCENLLSLVSACVQKEDYLYRKIINSSNFNKIQIITLLEKMLNYHPYFPARGNAFILLSAMDQSDHKVIINAMNTLLDENVVKEYSVIGIPLIHLLPNAFIDDLLESLKNESAIKAYEILKIFIELALNEKIDADGKTKIIKYLVNEIGQLKSKKPINYYYTEIKIPFTTTLENELYKAWIKIQGLSGKTQYFINIEESKE
ncbi:unnamed protein product [Rotaria sordida]|nr:unnamed protein product [Rotaria sordida]